MKCKYCIFLLLLAFLAAIIVINKITSRSERKTRVYLQGALYLNDLQGKKNDYEIMEKVLRSVDPDVLILKEPVTFYKDFWSEFEQEISPIEKDSLTNYYLNVINQVRNKLGFKIITLKLWDLEDLQIKRSFYNVHKNDSDFMVKIELYKRFNNILSLKINELNLMEDVFFLNIPLFDILKEMETEFFLNIFGEELKDFLETNNRYIDKIEDVIKENSREKIMVMYDSNLKHTLINRLEKNDKINLIRVSERKKSRGK